MPGELISGHADASTTSGSGRCDLVASTGASSLSGSASLLGVKSMKPKRGCIRHPSKSMQAMKVAYPSRRRGSVGASGRVLRAPRFVHLPLYTLDWTLIFVVVIFQMYKPPSSLLCWTPTSPHEPSASHTVQNSLTHLNHHTTATGHTTTAGRGTVLSEFWSDLQPK